MRRPRTPVEMLENLYDSKVAFYEELVFLVHKLAKMEHGDLLEELEFVEDNLAAIDIREAELIGMIKS